MNDPKETLRHYILAQHLSGITASSLGDRTALRSSGLLDSLALMGLISFVEKEFKIQFSALELTSESFDTIEEITTSIASKTK